MGLGHGSELCLVLGLLLSLLLCTEVIEPVFASGSALCLIPCACIYYLTRGNKDTVADHFLCLPDLQWEGSVVALQRP